MWNIIGLVIFIAIVAWIDLRKPPCPHTNTIDQGPDGVLCTDCGETV